MAQAELYRMYQAWQQGNENYIRDWYNFVEWSARWNNTSAEKMLTALQDCKWFKKGD